MAVNHGQGGIALSGYYVGPIKFERPGPIANDPLNRAVQLQSAAHCHIDTKNTGRRLAPMQSHLSFSVESWAKCEGGLDTTRYVLMTGRWVRRRLTIDDPTLFEPRCQNARPRTVVNFLLCRWFLTSTAIHRYSLLATRDNCWAASICTQDGSELYVLGPKVLHGEVSE